MIKESDIPELANQIVTKIIDADHSNKVDCSPIYYIKWFNWLQSEISQFQIKEKR